MKRILSGIFLALLVVAPLGAEERANLSTEDLIAGFEDKKLFYFEFLLRNGKYTKGFNKCLASKPAAAEWIREHCKKNPELKNAFQCSSDDGLTLVWFVYGNAALCEEVRGPMKDKMDALRSQ